MRAGVRPACLPPIGFVCLFFICYIDTNLFYHRKFPVATNRDTEMNKTTTPSEERALHRDMFFRHSDENSHHVMFDTARR